MTMCPETSNIPSGYEVVHTMHDYWDGPISGIADFDGHPHFYECIFDHKSDEYTHLYRLTPIDDVTFRLAIEDWNIWLRWKAALDSGKTTTDSHPALPEDKARHEELAAVLENSLKTSADAMVRAGTFLRSNDSTSTSIDRNPRQVRWEVP